MKLQSLLLVLACFGGVASARAQTGIYVNPVAIRISNSKADSGPFAFLGDNTTSRFFYGAAIGGYYEFSHSPRFDLGADIRDTIANGNGASLNSFMVGLRVAGHPSKFGFRPYLEPVVGAGTTRTALNPVHLTKLTYGVFGGLDLPIHKHVDFRAIEVGYGSLLTQNTQNYNGAFAFPSSTLITISSGLVFRFSTPAP